MHEAIDWSEHADTIHAFKHAMIYPVMIETESAERSMMKWLNTLSYHSYSERSATANVSVSYSAADQVAAGGRPELFSAAHNAGLIADRPSASGAAVADADDGNLAADTDADVEDGSAISTTAEIDEQEQQDDKTKVAIGD